MISLIVSVSCQPKQKNGNQLDPQQLKLVLLVLGLLRVSGATPVALGSLALDQVRHRRPVVLRIGQDQELYIRRPPDEQHGRYR